MNPRRITAALAAVGVAAGLALASGPAHAAPAAPARPAIAATAFDAGVLIVPVDGSGNGCGGSVEYRVQWSSTLPSGQVAVTGTTGQAYGRNWIVDANRLTTGSTVVERYQGSPPTLVPSNGQTAFNVGSTSFRTPPVWGQMHVYAESRPACGGWGQVQLHN